MSFLGYHLLNCRRVSTLKTKKMHQNLPEIIKTNLSELLTEYKSIHIDATKSDNIATYGFSADGRIHPIANLVDGGYEEQRIVTQVIFNVLSSISDTLFKPSITQHCVLSFGDSEWNASYTPLHDGFTLKIEREAEYSLSEFIRMEAHRIKEFATHTLLNNGCVDATKPLMGKDGWVDALAAFVTDQKK